MNRSIVTVGLLLTALGIGLIAFPWASTGQEGVDLELQFGVVAFPTGLALLFWGGLSPDPRLSTVPGLLGNPEENALRRSLSGEIPVGPARYRPSPRTTVNCHYCYTAIPTAIERCPRCGRRRECQVCNKPLFFLAGAVRCGPCQKDEVYCDCPQVRRPPAPYSAGARS